MREGCLITDERLLILATTASFVLELILNNINPNSRVATSLSVHPANDASCQMSVILPSLQHLNNISQYLGRLGTPTSLHATRLAGFACAGQMLKCNPSVWSYTLLLLLLLLLLLPYCNGGGCCCNSVPEAIASLDRGRLHWKKEMVAAKRTCVGVLLRRHTHPQSRSIESTARKTKLHVV